MKEFGTHERNERKLKILKMVEILRVAGYLLDEKFSFLVFTNNLKYVMIQEAVLLFLIWPYFFFSFSFFICLSFCL